MKKQSSEVVLFCIDTQIKYSNNLDAAISRWKHVTDKITVISDAVNDEYSNIVVDRNSIGAQKRILSGCLVDDYSRYRLTHLQDIVEQTTSDNVIVASLGFFPSNTSVFNNANTDKPRICAIDGWASHDLTADCMQFSKSRDAHFVKLLTKFANFVYENEDYFEFINKHKITNDFILNQFAIQFKDAIDFVKVPTLFIHDGNRATVNGESCIVDDLWYSKSICFDEKYELCVKNKSIFR
jgi:hypothetical protein